MFEVNDNLQKERKKSGHTYDRIVQQNNVKEAFNSFGGA